MRQRINRVVLCSSDKYKLRRLLHNDMLKERHSHLNELMVDGELSIDVRDKDNRSKFRTITISGKMKISMEEHNIHYKAL